MTTLATTGDAFVATRDTAADSHGAAAAFTAFTVCGICGRKPDSQRANSAGGSTRRMKSASARHGERKSSPEGS